MTTDIFALNIDTHTPTQTYTHMYLMYSISSVLSLYSISSVIFYYQRILQFSNKIVYNNELKRFILYTTVNAYSMCIIFYSKYTYIYLLFYIFEKYCIQIIYIYINTL